MNTPKRIQRRRTNGWRMPADAVYVGRPSRWGNPFRITPTGAPGAWTVTDGTITHRLKDATETDAATLAAALFALHTGPMGNHEYDHETLADLRATLAGRDLACWCPITQPCHADTLLTIANQNGNP